MNNEIKTIALMAGIKLKSFYPDEKKQMGWLNVTCTEFELERFVSYILQAKEMSLKEMDNSEK